ncbi:MAG TPA: hypothetical protein DEG43_14795 [Acidimicrobiaceae bacterium]|jgi:uncharacterized protein (DUF983 family)|nr:hypothetical protein [Acidimicrobiaceae bacterium]
MATAQPIQTDAQLGVSNLKLLARGVVVRCPACGAGATHTRFFRFNTRCHRCDLKFDRIVGHSIGYVGINTIVTFSATFVVMLSGVIAMHPRLNMTVLFLMTFPAAALLPVMMIPVSHTLWTAIDLIMRPLLPGEIDPRFVQIDPEMGNWKQDSAIRRDSSPDKPIP